jgi:cytochrome c5
MISRCVRIRLVVLAALGICIPSATALYSQAKSAVPAKPPAAKSAVKQHSGERVFMANCSRCHLPPMSISPRITGTVILHMRARARLSQEDQQLLLKYMAP